MSAYDVHVQVIFNTEVQVPINILTFIYVNLSHNTEYYVDLYSNKMITTWSIIKHQFCK